MVLPVVAAARHGVFFTGDLIALFTQCPECETIFKLSAEVLRAAAGEVRCGRCGEIFNALRSLAEEPLAFNQGESLREQEARADNILRFIPPEPPPQKIEELDEDFEQDGSPGTQIAHLEIQGAEDLMSWTGEDEKRDETFTKTIADDPSMEFTLPPGELDKIFVEARPRDFGRLKRSPAASPAPPPTSASGLHIEEFEPVSPEQIGAPQPVDDAEDCAPPIAGDAARATQTPRFTPAYLQSPDAGDSIEQIIPAEPWVEEPRVAAAHRGRWVAAATLFAVLLALQIVHHNRNALAQAAGIGSALRSLYAITGNPIPLHMNLAAFEVRQWGVTGDASASGTLRVRASVINTGPSAQPYPLLRLTLADRFGTRIGTRDFLPAEYLRKPPARPLDAGERADAIVEILDPGKTAEGFEIDVCDRAADSRVICANDAPARSK